MTNDSSLNFLVIGAQKCATTWLYECLNTHPQICLPKHKREIEYMGGPLYNENGGLQWYLSLLSHCDNEKVKGDVSVEYIINKYSPQLLHDLNPQMKFILSTRDPVTRAMSAIKWYTRKGALPANEDEIWQGFINAVKTFSPDEDIFSAGIYHDVLHRGLYHKLLKNYYDLFDASQFLIIPYEDVQKNPSGVLKSVFSFLNVDESFIPPNIDTKPKKNSNNKLLINIERKFSKNKLVSYAVNKLHQAFPGNEKQSYSENEKQLINIFTDFYDKHKLHVNPI